MTPTETTSTEPTDRHELAAFFEPYVLAQRNSTDCLLDPNGILEPKVLKTLRKIRTLVEEAGTLPQGITLRDQRIGLFRTLQSKSEPGSESGGVQFDVRQYIERVYGRYEEPIQEYEI